MPTLFPVFLHVTHYLWCWELIIYKPILQPVVIVDCCSVFRQGTMACNTGCFRLIHNGAPSSKLFWWRQICNPSNVLWIFYARDCKLINTCRRVYESFMLLESLNFLSFWRYFGVRLKMVNLCCTALPTFFFFISSNCRLQNGASPPTSFPPFNNKKCKFYAFSKWRIRHGVKC